MQHQEVGRNMLTKKIKNGKILSIDLKEIDKIGNTFHIKGDFTDPKYQRPHQRLFWFQSRCCFV